MNIQEALKTGRPIRRKSWEGSDYYKYEDNHTFYTKDILANDWEVEEEIETRTVFKDKDGDLLEVEYNKSYGTWFYTNEGTYGCYLTEKDIDKLLTFLYNNTEIGKSRIVPF